MARIASGKRLWFVVLGLGILLAVLTGCGTQQPDSLGSIPPVDTQPATETQGQPLAGLGTKPLEVTDWESYRAQNTSTGGGVGAVLETEDGYYFQWNSILYYADKVALDNWIPVCSRPDCVHTTTGGRCDAVVFSEVVLKDGRIYYNTDVHYTAALAGSGLRGEFVASMALDGTDKKLEYYIPEIEEFMGMGQNGFRSVLTEEFFAYSLSAMNEKGVFETYVYLADESGSTLLAEGTQESNVITSFSLRQGGIYGDSGFFTANLPDWESPCDVACRLMNGEATFTDLRGLNQAGSNLVGNSLWLYRANDGYYDVDVTTREEVKLADVQMENGNAYILLRNCILESSLLGAESRKQREGVESHALHFFNGETWQEVTLPEELLHAPDTVYLVPQAVTSDRILLLYQDAEKRYYEPVQLYQILLTTDTPVLEYLATLG